MPRLLLIIDILQNGKKTSINFGIKIDTIRTIQINDFSATKQPLHTHNEILITIPKISNQQSIQTHLKGIVSPIR